MSIIETAIQIALDAHRGQVDKGDSPYILHPLRVMQGVKTEEEKVVAVLHDVVEDTHYTFDDLRRKGIPEKCIEALRLLTHDKRIPYIEYIRGLADNPLARTVKLADLKDNSDLSRLVLFTDRDRERQVRYKEAIAFLKRKRVRVSD